MLSDLKLLSDSSSCMLFDDGSMVGSHLKQKRQVPLSTRIRIKNVYCSYMKICFFFFIWFFFWNTGYSTESTDKKDLWLGQGDLITNKPLGCMATCTGQLSTTRKGEGWMLSVIVHYCLNKIVPHFCPLTSSYLVRPALLMSGKQWKREMASW